MASTRIIEEEHGTYTGHLHQHNGYWAGDLFTSRDAGRRPSSTVRETTAATGWNGTW